MVVFCSDIMFRDYTAKKLDVVFIQIKDFCNYSAPHPKNLIDLT